MKHLFIINPAAGKGKTLKYIPEIQKMFEGKQEEYFIEVTKEPGHATEIVKKYVANENYRVYSIGGDGTLNEVLNGILYSGSTLAVIPGGSGNDFYKSIAGDSTGKNVLESVIRGKEKIMDIARVNKRYFINVSSAGFDAEVVYNAQYVKKLPLISGSLAYIVGIVLSVLRNTSYQVDITIDGNQFHEMIKLVAVANGKYYGGGMMPAPYAQIDDGEFDICLVKKMGRARILSLFPLYMKGKHEILEEVRFIRAKKIEIHSQKDMAINIDGEIEVIKDAAFEIIPGGISIVIPA